MGVPLPDELRLTTRVRAGRWDMGTPCSAHARAWTRAERAAASGRAAALMSVAHRAGAAGADDAGGAAQEPDGAAAAEEAAEEEEPEEGADGAGAPPPKKARVEGKVHARPARAPRRARPPPARTLEPAARAQEGASGAKQRPLRVPLSDAATLAQLADIQGGCCVCTLRCGPARGGHLVAAPGGAAWSARRRAARRAGDAAALGLDAAESMLPGTVAAHAPLAMSCWRGRGSLSVLVAKAECALLADKLGKALAARAAALQAGAGGGAGAAGAAALQATVAEVASAVEGVASAAAAEAEAEAATDADAQGGAAMEC